MFVKKWNKTKQGVFDILSAEEREHFDLFREMFGSPERLPIYFIIFQLTGLYLKYSLSVRVSVLHRDFSCTGERRCYRVNSSVLLLPCSSCVSSTAVDTYSKK